MNSKRKDFSEDGTSGALHKAIESVNSEFRAEREIALCLIEGFRLTVEYSLIKRGMKDAPVGRSYLSDLEHRINECKITLRRHDNNAYASMLRLEKLFAEKEAFQELMHKKVMQIGDDRYLIEFFDLRELLTLTDVRPRYGHVADH